MYREIFNDSRNLSVNLPPIITDDIAEDVMFEWANFVHLCHHYRYPLPLVKEYDGIEDYVCKNIREVQDNINAPICNLQSWQLCIRTFAFAETFTSWITGIILLQVPDSSSISSTTTLSYQK
ncbi:unnamed protein product [Rotaria sp. Silwood1]|nr:unnamed protein product [Rotaria sp. Silwood1]